MGVGFRLGVGWAIWFIGRVVFGYWVGYLVVLVLVGFRFGLHGGFLVYWGGGVIWCWFVLGFVGYWVCC